jgi:DNA modification methylase
MPDCSVDAVVTDPPYGLSFMGKKWDYDVPGVEVWAECLRVLKPGGHLLCFAGTRTQHRMAVRIEDAGFEIRDMIAWVYGSGFPKSLDVSKAIDKNNGEVGRLHKFTEWMRTTGLSAKQINDATDTFMGSHYLTDKSQPAIPTRALWSKLRPLCGFIPAWVDELVDRIEAEREVVGEKNSGLSAGSGNTVGKFTDSRNERGMVNITAPATDAAKQWQGWGTALKPALEPITVARKPLIGTVAENVLQHGTGAINVDGCRVGTEPPAPRNAPKKIIRGGKFHASADSGQEMSHYNPTQGRWPANFIHDGSEQVTDLLGSAARFFYCAKASKRDRDEGNHHPTVKPTDLMRYLCRLVTPPDGIVLDPFMGSGSTGKAAALEGFSFIGIEREAEYVAIAQARINHVTND